MIFNVLSLFALSVAVVPSVVAAVLDARAAPAILYPRSGTVWTQGYAHNVTWVSQPGTGSITLVNGGNTLPLKSGVDLATGRTDVSVPTVNGGGGYIIKLDVDGASATSGEFTIGTPDVPGPSLSISVVSSTTTVGASSASGVSSAASSASSIAASVTSDISSVGSSASSAAASISSSLASAESSLASGATSALSSVASHASSVISSVTSIAHSATSAAGSAAASGTSNAAIGAKGFADAKFGVFATAALVVVSTLAGASLL